MGRVAAGILASILAAGCGGATPPAAPPAAPTPPGQPARAARCAWDASPATPPGSGYRYHVTAGPDAEELCVDVDLPPGPTAQAWTGDPAMAPFVRDVGILRNGTLVPISTGAAGLQVPPCATGCRLRYRVLLGEAARALTDSDHAAEGGGALHSPPSAWLLRPRAVRAPFLLRVTTAPGEAFVSGLGLDPAGLFRGDVGALDEAPYSVFGPFTVDRRPVGGARVDVAFLHGRPAPMVDAWIDHALAAVAAYYGRFPVDHAALVVDLASGSGVHGGRTMGDGGAAVVISVGTSTPPAKLANEWMLVHELVHVSFPDVPVAWAGEGLATYVEPIIRVRSNLCDADELWRSLVEGLPQGQPEGGDGGLDVTDTWGRRYWGGALFWFVADVEIRKRTGNARSLDDALLAINRAGGNVSQRWDLERVLSVADQAVGADVLVPLRKQMGRSPFVVDLAAMWKALGVSEVRGKMVYDDAAPLAAVRRGIVAGKGR